MRLIIIAIFFGSVICYSQEYPRELDLNQAVEVSIKNNTDIRNANLEVQKAYKQRWATIATGLPKIRGNLNYQNYLEQPVALIPAQFFGGNEGEFAEVVFGTKQNFVASFNLEQLIFDGSYLVGLQSVKTFLAISDNTLTKTKQEIRKNVIQTYVNVLLSQANIGFIDENIASLSENLEESKQLLKAGFIEEESVEQLELTVSQQKSQLRYAERLERISLDMLKHLMGYPADAPLELSEPLEKIIIDATPKTDLFKSIDIREHVAQNIDVKIAENDVQSQFLLYKNEQFKGLPVFKAFLNGNYTGNSDEFTFLNSEQKWFGTAVFGFTADIPIFSSFQRSANSQRAKLNWKQSIETLENTKQEITLQINQTINDLQLASENLNISYNNLKLAERIANKNQIKFIEGLATSFEYREAQQQLFQAQQGLMQSVLELVTHKLELDTLMNTTF